MIAYFSLIQKIKIAYGQRVRQIHDAITWDAVARIKCIEKESGVVERRLLAHWHVAHRHMRMVRFAEARTFRDLLGPLTQQFFHSFNLQPPQSRLRVSSGDDRGNDVLGILYAVARRKDSRTDVGGHDQGKSGRVAALEIEWEESVYTRAVRGLLQRRTSHSPRRLYPLS